MKTKVLGEVTGKFEDDNFRIIIGQTGEACRIFCNDKELYYVRNINISMKAGSVTTIRIGYLTLGSEIVLDSTEDLGGNSKSIWDLEEANRREGAYIKEIHDGSLTINGKTYNRG